ncbi:MAG TPA: putative DNA-binding domain-containing protein [Vicinamibacterales bacterium]|nr:putative DNA-binding domain-containing protein [Vicinamibacterales bacterium]
MNLDQIQRAMFHAVRQPLTPDDGMRDTALDGTSLIDTAERVIKANDRLTSFERLEIYNRQYWFRLVTSMCDDFDGLRAVLGDKQFHKLAVGYLVNHPSASFTLRNLGHAIEAWLSAHRDYVTGVEDIALDMAKLGWAEVEAFDGESCQQVSAADLAQMGPDPLLRLQPYIQVLELSCPAHDLLLRLRARRPRKDKYDDNAPVRRLAARYLPKPQQTFVAVHRLENSVYFKDITAEAFAMLTCFKREATVSEAIEAVDWTGRSEEEIGTFVRDSFANWASLGWFCQPE